jgi:hypothetical protein
MHAVALPISTLRNLSRKLTVTEAGWRTEVLEPDQPKPEYSYSYIVLAAAHNQASCLQAMHCTLRNAHLAGKTAAMPSQKQWHKNVANIYLQMQRFLAGVSAAEVTSCHFQSQWPETCTGNNLLWWQTDVQAHHAAPQV